jgi:rare lipoprotein A (peptidoglycan hydrolase)
MSNVANGTGLIRAGHGLAARLCTLVVLLAGAATQSAVAQDARFWTEQLTDKPQPMQSDRPRARGERRPDTAKSVTKGLETEPLPSPRAVNDIDRTALAATGKRQPLADNALASEALAVQIYARRDRTAFGEALGEVALICAHAWLPLDSTVLVTDTATGRAVIVKVKDRPQSGRADVIELAKPALAVLGTTVIERAKVRLTVLWVPTGEPQFWPRPRLPGVQAVSAD